MCGHQLKVETGQCNPLSCLVCLADVLEFELRLYFMHGTVVQAIIFAKNQETDVRVLLLRMLFLNWAFALQRLTRT